MIKLTPDMPFTEYGNAAINDGFRVFALSPFAHLEKRYQVRFPCGCFHEYSDTKDKWRSWKVTKAHQCDMGKRCRCDNKTHKKAEKLLERKIKLNEEDTEARYSNFVKNLPE